jgi:hypothetical protein
VSRSNLTKGSSSSSSGIGVMGLLGVAFIVLKLTGVIDWSWWYVTMPLWGGLVIVLAVLAVLGIVYLVADYLDKRKKA